jgi:DNA-binding transcriptional LysR family regulator
MNKYSFSYVLGGLSMELKHLRYFALAAELQHITQAAEQLLVSQPFLTKIINQLEDELGVELFDHVGRKIKLNEFGWSYYVRVKSILRELESAQNEVAEMAGRAKHTVTIITNVSAYMPTLLASFHKIYPGLTICQLSAKRHQIQESLQAGGVDYALCVPPLEEDEEFSIRTENVKWEEALVMFSPNHPLRAKNVILLAELEKQNYITAPIGYGMRDGMDIHFKRKGVRPRIVIETSDTSAMPNYVRSGLGFACLPKSVVWQNVELRKECCDFSESDIGAYVALSWNEKQYKSETHHLFYEFLKDYFKELGAFCK